MGTRQSRVEELLRREIAGALLRGDIKDHRVREQAAISVTGVRVSPDLSVARVFVDVLAGGPPVARVVEGLNAAGGVFRRHLNQVLRMRRIPSLRFERDDAIEQGARIEQVLAELRSEEADRVSESEEPTESSSSTSASASASESSAEAPAEPEEHGST